MDLIELGLKTTGFNIIPNLFAFKIKDLFEIFRDKFGLKYTLGKPRISEKLHEMMISKEEVPRTYYDNDKNVYLMHYSNIYKGKFKWEEFTSDVTTVSKSDLHELLAKHNYFKI